MHQLEKSIGGTPPQGVAESIPIKVVRRSTFFRGLAAMLGYVSWFVFGAGQVGLVLAVNGILDAAHLDSFARMVLASCVGLVLSPVVMAYYSYQGTGTFHRSLPLTPGDYIRIDFVAWLCAGLSFNLAAYLVSTVVPGLNVWASPWVLWVPGIH